MPAVPPYLPKTSKTPPDLPPAEIIGQSKTTNHLETQHGNRRPRLRPLSGDNGPSRNPYGARVPSPGGNFGNEMGRFTADVLPRPEASIYTSTGSLRFPFSFLLHPFIESEDCFSIFVKIASYSFKDRSSIFSIIASHVF